MNEASYSLSIFVLEKQLTPVSEYMALLVSQRCCVCVSLVVKTLSCAMIFSRVIKDIVFVVVVDIIVTSILVDPRAVFWFLSSLMLFLWSAIDVVVAFIVLGVLVFTLWSSFARYSLSYFCKSLF